MQHKNRKPGQQLKNFIRNVHLWLGLASGIVVFIVATTGCCWVFQEEINALITDPITVTHKHQPLITPTEAKNIAGTVFPDKHIHGTLYGSTTEPVEVIFYEANPEFYSSVLLDPYNGEVLKTENHLEGFFPFILSGHMHLWLPETIGSEIVAYGTLIFVVMLITGIVLWWPKKQNRRQRFKLDWKTTTKWKRKNFDLHAVFGFYTSLIALIIAITGLTMTFDWVAQLVYSAMGGEKSITFTIPENKTGKFNFTSSGLKPIDRLVPILKNEYPQAKSLEVHYPATDSSSIYVEISYKDGTYYKSDYRYYDQSTLEELKAPSLYGAYEKAGLSDKVIRMNYDIHVGAILGFPGKLLAFFISLIIATLPVTGFLMWWGRRRKSKQKQHPKIKSRNGNKTQVNGHKLRQPAFTIR